jgi:hypothetical protein
MRQRSRSPWPSRLAWALIATAAIAFVVVAARNLGRHDMLTAWRHDLEAGAGNPAWPAWSPSWPALRVPARRRQIPQDLSGPYAYAARNASILQRIPCFCGCVREGHRSNLNCFVSGFRSDGTPIWTDHSFTCDMCVHIAREVMLMSSQGMSVERIREEIDSRYRVVGPPTATSFSSHAEHLSR